MVDVVAPLVGLVPQQVRAHDPPPSGRVAPMTSPNPFGSVVPQPLPQPLPLLLSPLVLQCHGTRRWS